MIRTKRIARKDRHREGAFKQMRGRKVRVRNVESMLRHKTVSSKDIGDEFIEQLDEELDKERGLVP